MKEDDNKVVLDSEDKEFQTAVEVEIDDHENLSKNQLGRFREDPFGYMLRLTNETNAFYRGIGWRRYDNYVGARIFQPNFTEKLKVQVLNSPQVESFIQDLSTNLEPKLTLVNFPTKLTGITKIEAKRIAKLTSLKERIDAIRWLLKNRANNIINNLQANLCSLPFIKWFCFSLDNLFKRMYHQGLYVRESEIQTLMAAARTAQESNLPLIILPCHKSHIDYLVISYLFFRLGLSLPYIAAGDNLNLPILGPFLKRGGAFFIKRSWTDDKLYGNVATEYLQTLLEYGFNVECFVEGTRSRTGKLLNPKFGILRIVLDAYLKNRIKDAIIVPISIGYDRVIETSSYVTELLGNPKEKESLYSLLTTSHILQLKWGRIDIRFAKPFSLREFVLKENNKRSEDLDPEQRIILRALGYRVMSDINNVSVVMPTALVGTVLLTLRGRGIGQKELLRRVNWLRRHIALKGGRVAHFANMPLATVVDRAINIIKDLVGTRPDLIEPVYFAIDTFELSYYRNQVIHIFIAEAIVSVCMYTTIKKGGTKLDQRIPYKTLLDEVTFLSRLLKWDFVYPFGPIDYNLQHSLKFLQDSNVVTFDSNFVGLSDKERELGRENYGNMMYLMGILKLLNVDFYCFLLWPFVESYWLAAVSLFAFASLTTKLDTTPTSTDLIWVDSSAFLTKVQQLGKTLYYEGDLSYLEAINTETIRNAFNYLKESKVLLTKEKLTTLHPDFIPKVEGERIVPNGNLWDLVEMIGRFRREGKNRRDNATVSIRVLRLAKLVGSTGTWNLAQSGKPPAPLPVPKL